MSPTQPPTAAARAAGRVPVLVAGAAWASLAVGLFAHPDARGWGDLEAGGRFAVGLAVHVPFLAVGLVVTLAVAAGVLARSATSVPAVAVVLASAVFALPLLRAGELAPAQPHLSLAATAALVLGALALLASEAARSPGEGDALAARLARAAAACGVVGAWAVVAHGLGASRLLDREPGSALALVLVDWCVLGVAAAAVASSRGPGLLLLPTGVTVAAAALVLAFVLADTGVPPTLRPYPTRDGVLGLVLAYGALLLLGASRLLRPDPAPVP